MKRNDNSHMRNHDSKTEICDSDPVVDPRGGKPHTRLLEFQNQYKTILQSAEVSNVSAISNNCQNSQNDNSLIKSVKQDK